MEQVQLNKEIEGLKIEIATANTRIDSSNSEDQMSKIDCKLISFYGTTIPGQNYIEKKKVLERSLVVYTNYK